MKRSEMHGTVKSTETNVLHDLLEAFKLNASRLLENNSDSDALWEVKLKLERRGSRSTREE